MITCKNNTYIQYLGHSGRLKQVFENGFLVSNVVFLFLGIPLRLEMTLNQRFGLSLPDLHQEVKKMKVNKADWCSLHSNCTLRQFS